MESNGSQLGSFVKAVAFAAEKHRNQRRKDADASPYINHPIALANVLANEGGVSDGRHPDGVRFVTDIREDLARRDFTVGAMAWHPERGLCDPFGGQTDLKNGVLRAVGDADTF